MESMIKYIGVNDKTLDLFESQYIVPNGISYNSYVILDDKITIMDTVDQRASQTWLVNVKEVLGNRQPDYLVVSHMEPDHCANIKVLCELYPEMKVVGNAKTFMMMKQFFRDYSFDDRQVIVKENDTINLGKHTLRFLMAPMVHWPEVMVTYEENEKVLFSADAFGKFGTLDTDEDWAYEARRYYFNIVGKYGLQVQALLKKVAKLDVQTICPLHGPILKENLSYYINKYNIWSSYQYEDKGVFIAYASIHGHSVNAVKELQQTLKDKGIKVAVSDLTREDNAKAVEDAFRYSHMVLVASSYDGGVFTPMADFLAHLKAKNYQNRTVAFIENGSWAPCANRVMKEVIGSLKNITMIDQSITIRSTLSKENKEELLELANQLL